MPACPAHAVRIGEVEAEVEVERTVTLLQRA
jgi:hypothetical protein